MARRWRVGVLDQRAPLPVVLVDRGRALAQQGRVDEQRQPEQAELAEGGAQEVPGRAGDRDADEDHPQRRDRVVEEVGVRPGAEPAERDPVGDLADERQAGGRGDVGGAAGGAGGSEVVHRRR